MTKKDIFFYILGTFAFIFCGPFVMFVLALTFPISFLPSHDLVKFTGIAAIAFGVVFVFWSNYALVRFGKGGAGVLGPIKLMTETKHLVTTGPYAMCRNPMHFGLVIYFLVIGIALNNLASLIIPILMCIFAYVMAVVFDEPRLKKDFPQEYNEWASNVPRFFPRLVPYKTRS